MGQDLRRLLEGIYAVANHATMPDELQSGAAHKTPSRIPQEFRGQGKDSAKSHAGGASHVALRSTNSVDKTVAFAEPSPTVRHWTLIGQAR